MLLQSGVRRILSGVLATVVLVGAGGILGPHGGFASEPTRTDDRAKADETRGRQGAARPAVARFLSRNAAGPLAADDEIPGVSLAESPIIGSLDASIDTDDVFMLDLAEGDTLAVSLTASAGTDFDVSLFDANATSIWESTPVSAASSNSYPETLSYIVYAGHAGPHYLDITAYGGAGNYTCTFAISPGTATVGPEGVPLAMPDGSPQTTVRIPSPVVAVDQYFGDAVAISPDTFVIGKASNAQPAVYVAEPSASGWGQPQKLPATPASSGALGRSVAIEADAIAGGAPNEARVYVWRRSGGIWGLDTTLAAAGVSYLGTDVAISGDRLVAGGMGGVAIYRRDATGWTTEQTIVHGGWFGASVDIDRDTLAVGDALSGTVTLFRRAGTTWTAVETLTDVGGARVALDGKTLAVGTDISVHVYENTAYGWEWQEELFPKLATDESNGFFGKHLALSGDRLVVGAPHDDQQATASGAVYLFCRTEGGWVEDSRWAPLSAELGSDVAIDGGWIAGGTHGESVAGAAYAFSIDREYRAPGGYTLTAPAAGVLRNDLGAGLVAELVDDAAYGHVILRPDGSFSYQQDSKRLGVDSFSYRVWNGYVYSPAVQVRINVVEPTVQVTTLAGATRFETSVRVSKESFPFGADTVVLATGRNWPDALGGSALASAVEGPILLCETDYMPKPVRDEIIRLAPSEVILLGLEGALAADIEFELEAMGIEFITRLGGEDRYETAQMVADEALWRTDWDGTVLVATGRGFADALAASPLAAGRGWPIYLADPKAEPDELTMVLSEIGATNAIVLGGEAAVSDRQFTSLSTALPDGAVRLAGGSRYSTAVEIATYGVSAAGLSWDGLGLAVGTDFPDGLSGGGFCGVNQRVLLLTNGVSLSPETAAALRAQSRSIFNVCYIGGTSVIRSPVREQVSVALRK